MFGFFKEVNIRQGEDCYGMWLILRVKWIKCRSEATIYLDYMGMFVIW